MQLENVLYAGMQIAHNFGAAAVAGLPSKSDRYDSSRIARRATICSRRPGGVSAIKRPGFLRDSHYGSFILSRSVGPVSQAAGPCAV